MPQALTLHLLMGSPFSMKALQVSYCLNLNVKFAFYHSTWQLKTNEYLAINPKGTCPALETDQGTLIESEVIVRYLASLDGKALLNGRNLFEKAKVDEMHSLIDELHLSLFAIRGTELGRSAGVQKDVSDGWNKFPM